jgi:hypothetical protein
MLKLLGLLGFWTLTIVQSSNEHNVSEIDLFLFSGERVGDT